MSGFRLTNKPLVDKTCNELLLPEELGVGEGIMVVLLMFY